MRTLLEVFKALLLDIVFSLGISAIISGVRSIFTNVTWTQFFAGAAGILAFFILDWIYNLVRTLTLMKKDPIFKTMTETTGISWRDYKRMKKK